MPGNQDFMEAQTEPKRVCILISDDEREDFLTRNSIPQTFDESYLWIAIENAGDGLAVIFEDEVQVAAKMARNAGLEELAKRIEEKCHG